MQDLASKKRKFKLCRSFEKSTLYMLLKVEASITNEVREFAFVLGDYFLVKRNKV